MFTIEWKLLLKRLLATCLLIFFAGMLMRSQTSQTLPPTTTTTTQPIEWTEESLNNLIEQVAKEEHFDDVYLLKQLAWHESRYLEHDKIVDTNGYYSYGLMHFQLYTFLEQAELYKVIPENTELDEGRILIMNPELQIKTICRMGNDNRKIIRVKWRNSWNKIYDL